MDRPDAPAARRGRGRRPADEVRADVLRAVGAILLDEGLAGLTFERVARESGVSKTTLDKWWPSVGALALDGYFHAVEDTLAFPDTGDIRADVTAQLRSFITLMTRTPAGRLLTELIGQAQTDPELAAQYRRLYSSQRRRLAVDRFQAAQQVGQLRADVDPQVLVDQLWDAVYHRLLVPDEPVGEELADALVRNLFDGVAWAGAVAARGDPARGPPAPAWADVLPGRGTQLRPKSWRIRLARFPAAELARPAVADRVPRAGSNRSICGS